MTGMCVRIGDLELDNPVMTAAGCGGTGPELARFLDLAALGGFVTRTLSIETKPDAPPPQVAETASGWLVEDALHNRSLQAFLMSELPALAAAHCRTIVSITGRSLGEHAELARRAGGAPGVVGLELLLTEPEPHAAGQVVGLVRREAPSGVAVLVKVPFQARADLVSAVVDNGADAVVVGQPPDGLTVDPSSLRPAVRGGLGGAAVLPLTTHQVWRAYSGRHDVPIVAVGGIRTGADALALMAAGASAVQVGSATLHDPTAPARIATELADLLTARALNTADAVGIAHRGGLP
jgi:dihydroorotate dehydrogenase (NAD+) catalytic subunit